MTAIRIYTDEDVAAEIAVQLRRHGYDALSCREAGNHNLRHPDHWQLSFATNLGRAIVTRNAPDFVRLDTQWKMQGLVHAGIICLDRDPSISAIMRCLRRHLDQVTAEEQSNTLYWAW